MMNYNNGKVLYPTNLMGLILGAGGKDGTKPKILSQPSISPCLQHI